MTTNRSRKRCQALALLKAAGIDASDLDNAVTYELMRLAGYRWEQTDIGYRWLMSKEIEVI